MSFSGLASKTLRAIKRQLKRITGAIRGKFPAQEKGENVPRSWVIKKNQAKGKRKGQLAITKTGEVIVSRKVHHWPWLRNFKRGLAALLLLFNFGFSQFLMVSQGMIFAFFFFGNTFILIDYLWKTRRKEE